MDHGAASRCRRARLALLGTLSLLRNNQKLPSPDTCSSRNRNHFMHPLQASPGIEITMTGNNRTHHAELGKCCSAFVQIRPSKIEAV